MSEFNQLNKSVTENVEISKFELEQRAKSVNEAEINGQKLLELLLKKKKITSIDNNASSPLKIDVNIDLDDLWLCQIDELTYVDKAPQKEGMENIVGTFRGLRGFNFIYIILGDGKRARFYLGVVRNKYMNTLENKSEFTVEDVGERLLKPAIQGNFRGCKLSTVPVNKYAEKNDKQDIMDKRDILMYLQDPEMCVGRLEGVPSTDSEQNNPNSKENFQGTDRLIDVMQGCRYGLVVIAHPCMFRDVARLHDDVCSAADMLTPLLKRSIQYSTSQRISYNDNASASAGHQSGKSTQGSRGDNFTYTEGSNSDVRKDMSYQISKSANDMISTQTSHNKTYEFSKENGSNKRECIHDSADANSKSSQCATGKNYNVNSSVNSSEARSENKQHVESNTFSENISKNISKNNQLTKSEVADKSYTDIRQMDFERKSVEDWLKYIDEVLLPRLDNGRGKGVFDVCTYIFAESNVDFRRLANTTISLYSGKKGNKIELCSRRINPAQDIVYYDHLKNLQIPIFPNGNSETLHEAVMSKRSMSINGNNYLLCGNWMSAKELSLLSGFPRREVIGLKLREEVEFGINVDCVKDEHRIELGKMVQCGHVLDEVKVSLDKTQLDKHMFIAGVTGSGKTTTCQNILLDCDLPFLVIEPVKTEYRALNNNLEFKKKNIIYFTPGKQQVAPFFLNPFELFPGEEISSRADMLKATFEASFEMEAAIPQIMGTAIYKAYKDKGWNTSNTTWRNKDTNSIEDPFAAGVNAFPTLSDYKVAVKSVIDSQGFDDRLRDEYLGSINARIESLMIGAKGQMLNTPRSIDFKDLVTRQVVIELEEIKSGSEKSLIMGLIITNLLQAVKSQKKDNKKFRHITLVEEAHRLLSRYMPGDSRNQKQGVEVFSDMLAEVRKYGESLIIVDQIPDKMTPEVLKNTNTKIVHKLFAKDDKDTIGNTMALTEEQKNFLSNLPPGRAVVFSQGWEKAVQVQVSMRSDTSDNDIEEDEIHNRSLEYYSDPEIAARGVIPGLDDIPTSELTTQKVDELMWLYQQSYQWFTILENRIMYILEGNGSNADSDEANNRPINDPEADVKNEDIVSGIKEALERIDSTYLAKYIEKRLGSLVYDEEEFAEKTLDMLNRLSSSKKMRISKDIIKVYLAAITADDILIKK